MQYTPIIVRLDWHKFSSTVDPMSLCEEISSFNSITKNSSRVKRARYVWSKLWVSCDVSFIAAILWA